MDTQKLELTASQIVADDRGLLAADESTPSCKKRFDAVGLECTPDTRRKYREVLITVPEINKSLNGVIFYDETFWQGTSDKKLFREYLVEQGVLPGIKVDLGLVDLPGFPGEKVSRGLDSLPERIDEYAEFGARFAKWRSTIAIGDGMPTNECIGANTYVLSRYARICQDAGIVPIVEPEVLFDGEHSIEQCEEVMARTFDILFQTMRAYRVHLPGAILKTSFVLPGKRSGHPIQHDDTAERTLRVFYDHVPHELGGIVFLSGGETSRDALINLNRISKRGDHPWGISFSYSRALQDPVLKSWVNNRSEASQLFQKQLGFATAARRGELDEDKLDKEDFVSKSQDS